MTPHSISPGGKSTRFYYYYRCSNHMKASYDGCSNYRHYRAKELEEQVWREVRGLEITKRSQCFSPVAFRIWAGAHDLELLFGGVEDRAERPI